MRVKWMHAGLHFRSENNEEEKWLCQFAEMLEGGKFVFEPPTYYGAHTDDDETVTLLD